MKKSRLKDWLMFLLGLFSWTQISLIGYIGISELICYVVAPVVFWRNIDFFRRYKMMLYLGLIVLWMLFALNADVLIYHKKIEVVLKGVALPYSFFAVSVCTLVLLRDRFQRLNWFIVGTALTYVLSTFVFQQGAVVGEATLLEASDGSAMNAAMSYKLYWLALVGLFFQLPAQIRFLKTPLIISVGLVIVAAVFSLFGGGRSSFLVTLVSCGFLMMGQRVRSPTYRPKPKSIVPITVFAVLLGLGAKGLYTYTVKQGWLGDDEKQKYDQQTKIGTSALSLLMSGRGDFWIALSAIKDKPFFGHGYKAPDVDGYQERWVEKYGDTWDIRRFRSSQERGISEIPSHSCILMSWVAHGVGGLLFWIYVLCLIYKTMTVWMWYVPEWFGWLVTISPAWIWAIFFSPPGARVGLAVFGSVMLLARCVYNGVVSPDGIGRRPVMPRGVEDARWGVGRMR